MKARRYRARLAADPLDRENYAFAQREGFLLDESRTFLERVRAAGAFDDDAADGATGMRSR